MKIFIYSVIGIVAVSIIAGFFIVGSPLEERKRRFDDERVGHLQTLQWQILNYWQNKGRLPENLAMLRDDIAGFIPPQDPETGAEYEYEVKGETTFALCATFNLPSDLSQTPGHAKTPYAKPITPVPLSSDSSPLGAGERLENPPWDHGVGRTCFERTIDKELYPVRPRDKTGD